MNNIRRPALALNMMTIAAICVGVSVPSLIFGRAVLAIFLIFGIFAIIASGGLRGLTHEVLEVIRSPLGIMVSITALAWLPGAIDSSFPVRSFEAIFRSSFLILIAWFVYHTMCHNTWLYDICIKSLMASTAIAVFIAILSAKLLPELLPFIRLKGWKENNIDNMLKGFSAISLFLVPAMVIFSREFGARWGIIAMLSAMGLMVVVWESYNRAAMAGFLAEIICIGVAFSLRKASKMYAIFSLLAAFGLTIIIFEWLKASRGYIMSTEAGMQNWLFPIWLIDYERQTIWQHVVDIGFGTPWFGIGANTVNFTPGANELIPGTHALHVVPAHPHNWLVEVFVETGIVGLSCLIVTIIAVFYHFMSKYRSSGSGEYVAAIAAFAGYWMSGLFNFSYWSAWWQLSCYLLIAIFLVPCSKRQSTSVNRQRNG